VYKSNPSVQEIAKAGTGSRRVSMTKVVTSSSGARTTATAATFPPGAAALQASILVSNAQIPRHTTQIEPAGIGRIWLQAKTVPLTSIPMETLALILLVPARGIV